MYLWDKNKNILLDMVLWKVCLIFGGFELLWKFFVFGYGEMVWKKLIKLMSGKVYEYDLDVIWWFLFLLLVVYWNLIFVRFWVVKEEMNSWN